MKFQVPAFSSDTAPCDQLLLAHRRPRYQHCGIIGRAVCCGSSVDRFRRTGREQLTSPLNTLLQFHVPALREDDENQLRFHAGHDDFLIEDCPFAQDRRVI